MRRMITALTAGGFLALALAIVPAGAALAQMAGDQLEEVLVVEADTPAEHKALAAYYRDKAEEARTHVKHHQAMAKRYAAYKGQDMRKHCLKLVTLNEQTAAEYDGLANGHEAAAAK